MCLKDILIPHKGLFQKGEHNTHIQCTVMLSFTPSLALLLNTTTINFSTFAKKGTRFLTSLRLVPSKALLSLVHVDQRPLDYLSTGFLYRKGAEIHYSYTYSCLQEQWNIALFYVLMHV